MFEKMYIGKLSCFLIAVREKVFAFQFCGMTPRPKHFTQITMFSNILEKNILKYELDILVKSNTTFYK